MRYDAVMVDMKTTEVTLMGRNHDLENAEAICTMAVLRRGVETHFYATAVTRKYNDGGKWVGDGIAQEAPHA